MRCFALGFLLLAPLAAAAPPELRVEGPVALETVAAQIRRLDPSDLVPAMELAGLEEGGAPIRVVLAPEGSEAARAVPSWISGYARGEEGLVVVFPARTPGYPDGGLGELIRHEVAHVLVARAARGAAVPRWFNEGLAMFAGRPWTVEDRARFTWELLFGERVALGGMDRLFAGPKGDVSRAYAISGAFFRDLLETYGTYFPRRVLRLLARGHTFDEAFEDATGLPLGFEEYRFWRRQRSWDRWVPFLTSTVTIWMGVTLLALWAIKRRRERDRALALSWDEEARRLSQASGPRAVDDLSADDGHEDPRPGDLGDGELR